MLTVNLISKLSRSAWTRQESQSLRCKWTYSFAPVEADVHVVYGVIEPVFFPRKPSCKIFVAIEPPEIFQYDLDALRQYDLVVAPDFAYLQSLKNLRCNSGLLNWNIGAGDHSKDSLEVGWIPDEDFILSQKRTKRISVVMSSKSITPLQQERVTFVDALRSHVPELVVFGRDTKPISDKLDAILPYQFHLAIENSMHDAYWTEKLSDPLLCLTKVFYIGDPQATAVFGRDCVVPLRIDDMEFSAKTIKETLDVGITTACVNKLLNARNMILQDLNLHAVIEAEIGDTFSHLKQTSSIGEIGRHRRSCRVWLLFHLDVLRRKFMFFRRRFLGMG